MILLKNGYICVDGDLIVSNVLIDGEYIVDVNPDIKENDGDTVIDCKGLWVRQGAVDPHVHLREPGFTHKETILSGTHAAAKGGVTTVFAMANLNPVPDCQENLKIQLDIIKKDACIRVIPFSALTKGQDGEVPTALSVDFSTVIGYSDDGRGVWNIPLLIEMMNKAKSENATISSHAEDEEAADSREQEYLAVKREIALNRHIKCKYHFCHLSTAEALEEVRIAKAMGADITCETAPHYFTLCEEDIENTNFKMNPPLRKRNDMNAAKRAIINGTVDMIATDHAPHAENEKAVDYAHAPNGIIGLETSLPAVYTEFVKTNLINHERMIDITTNNALARFGLPPRYIEKGEIADICALDIENEREYRKEEIVSKSKNSPFIGRKFFGFNKLTIYRGKIIYESK